MPSHSSLRRSTSALVAAMLVLTTALVPGIAAAAEADPAAGFDATWTVTRPNDEIRADGAVAVGDDLAVSFDAVDGVPATRCQIAITTADAYVNVPGAIDDGVCRLSMRLPNLPSPEWRALWAPAEREICVFVSLWFADGQSRTMIGADDLQPGGSACGNVASQTFPKLSFHLDEAGATDRPFVSDPPFISWDPTDWGTDMQPLRFGETWRFALPDLAATCEPELNGTWQTSIRAMPGDTCVDWDVRLPGVLPQGLEFQGEAVWHTSLSANYSVAGVDGPFTVVSHTTVPLEASDGVFESNLPAIFPVDLASTRFVTIGEPWRPTYQVSGTSAVGCRLTMYDNQGNDFAVHDVAPDEASLCTFDVPPLVADEHHQYHVVAFPESDPTSQMIVFGGSIEAIPAPEPPVIDPPVITPGDETTIEVEAGDGLGLVVDLEITGGTATPACADQAASPDLAVGGDIPTLATSCDLGPGAYTATASMIDAAGVVATAQRTFSIPHARPKITARTPAISATGVARDVRPSVTFDLPVAGVSATSMRLLDVSANTFIAATVMYDAATRTATIRPSTLLRAGRAHRVYLSAVIKATATDRPISATTWSFTTAMDATTPTIIGRTPAVGATGVSRTYTPAVRFSEPIKGATSTSFQLRDTVTGAYTPAIVRYDAAQRRASLDPTGTLVARRRYLVIVRSTIRDYSGNPTLTTTWSFTTGT